MSWRTFRIVTPSLIAGSANGSSCSFKRVISPSSFWKSSTACAFPEVSMVQRPHLRPLFVFASLKSDTIGCTG
ncbi:hypothetical protein BJX66DRAFT_320972 [Aspergillus keveii]|uniref:Secreted protein n=1 Tax=Aspergillus keveii TaxID=714993 RepID=A0ABR4FGF3_9EURO